MSPFHAKQDPTCGHNPVEIPDVVLVDPALLEKKPQTEEERQALRVAFAHSMFDAAFLVGLIRKPKIHLKKS